MNAPQFKGKENFLSFFNKLFVIQDKIDFSIESWQFIVTGNILNELLFEQSRIISRVFFPKASVDRWTVLFVLMD